MTSSRIRARIVAERVSWIREMIRAIRALPLTSYDAFASDPRNVASAESYLRRGIEALLDLGRHMLAKGFGVAAAEYKDIGAGLAHEGVLSKEQGALLRQIAGYRNRMVHFYHEVTQEELYHLSTHGLIDLETLLEALVDWLRTHPEKTNE